MTTYSTAGPDPISIYTGRTTNWSMVWSTCFAAVFVLVIGKKPDEPWGDLTGYIVFTGLVVVASVLTASSIRATAGPNGFTVHWGYFGWPRCRYALAEIEGAGVVNVSAWRVHPWPWWTPRRTSCLARKGPAVQLTLRNGRTIVVTVPDPEAAVAALHHASAQRPIAGDGT